MNFFIVETRAAGMAGTAGKSSISLAVQARVRRCRRRYTLAGYLELVKCRMAGPSQPPGNITHILFDFFGTLVEYSDSRTEQGYFQSHEVLRSNGATIGYEEFLSSWANLFRQFDAKSENNLDEYSMNDVVTAFLRQVLPPTTCLNAVDVFRDTYLREWNKGVQYIQGVTSLLSRLAHRYTLVLVTNTHSAELVKTHLMRMEVEDFFSIVVTSVAHGKRKPSESIFRHALKASAAENSTAVYVGDSFQTDYLGSRTVGIRCLLIDPYKKHGIPARDRLMHVLDLETVLSLEY